MFRLVRSSIIAGIAIGCGGYGFLASGIQSDSYGPLFGSILFCFGLMTVVAYKLALYTGTAGFIKKNEIGRLFIILGGNIIGCFIMGMISRVSPLDIQEAAQNVLSLRIDRGPLRCGLLGIPCGFMMTTAVTFARRQHYIPLLLAVPLFIVCGFTHCIADAFYYSCVPFEYIKDHAFQIMMVYVSIVLGNLIGCNLYRIVLPDHEF
jgi:formate/nitrite transporter FocA (FNT family)